MLYKTNIKSLVFILISLVYSLTFYGQQITNSQKERLKYKVDLFSTEEKALQMLWYEDRMDLMRLKGDLRDIYQKIIAYHVYKMERLDDIDKALDKDEIILRLKYQVEMMNRDVMEILNENQYKLHKDSWNAILMLVYRKKKWN